MAVPITADTIDEVDETVVLTLTNPTAGATLGALATTTLTIADDDEAGLIQFAAAAATVAEDNPATVTVRVTRTGKNLASAVKVDLAVTGGTAIHGADFTLSTGTLTFGAGEAAKDLVLGRVIDGLAEGPETIVLGLSNPTGRATLGAQSTMVITLVGSESAVGFSLPSFSVIEGTPMSDPHRAAHRAAHRDRDRAGADDRQPRWRQRGRARRRLSARSITTLTFPPGMASRTLTVAILNNTRRDGTRTVALALSNPSAGLALGTQRTTVLSIADNDEPAPSASPPTTVTVSNAAGGRAHGDADGQGSGRRHLGGLRGDLLRLRGHSARSRHASQEPWSSAPARPRERSRLALNTGPRLSNEQRLRSAHQSDRRRDPGPVAFPDRRHQQGRRRDAALQTPAMTVVEGRSRC